MVMNRRTIINYIRDNFDNITGVDPKLGIYFTIPVSVLAEASEMHRRDFMGLIRGDE